MSSCAACKGTIKQMQSACCLQMHQATMAVQSIMIDCNQSAVTPPSMDYKMQHGIIFPLGICEIADWHWLVALDTQTSTLDCSTNTSDTGTNRFPFNNFTHCLTPFSRCFSSFLHSTCLLSVSCQYLALDGIYHPFWAAFPNNSTLWHASINQCTDTQTGLSPSVMLHSRRLVHQCINHDPCL